MTAGADGGATKIAFADIPEDQRFSFRITPQPGRLLNLETAGGTLTQLGKLFKALGRDIKPSVEWYTALAGTEIEADGTVRFDIVVLPKKAAPQTTPQESER